MILSLVLWSTARIRQAGGGILKTNYRINKLPQFVTASGSGCPPWPPTRPWSGTSRKTAGRSISVTRSGGDREGEQPPPEDGRVPQFEKDGKLVVWQLVAPTENGKILAVTGNGEGVLPGIRFTRRRDWFNEFLALWLVNGIR